MPTTEAKLKARFFLFQNYLAFTIDAQTPLFKGRDRTFRASNGYRIASIGCADLNQTEIYLDTDADAGRIGYVSVDGVSYSCVTKKLEDYLTALREWSASQDSIPYEEPPLRQWEYIEESYGDPARVSIGIIKLGNNILVWVRYLDERFIGIDRSRQFISSDGFFVSSVCSIELSTSGIYLTGSDDSFGQLVSMQFTTEKNRDKYVTRLLKALEEWSKKCDIVSDPPEITPVINPGPDFEVISVEV